MPKRLTKLRIAEISAVDRGAGEGVRILLMKRDGDQPSGGKMGKKAAIDAYLKRNLFEEAEAQATLEKREFSSEERQRLAGTGAAESDGSFPIANQQDLKNAIRAVGRSKNPGKTRAHIMSRARSLGLTSLIPGKWKGANKALAKSMDAFLKSIGLDKALDFNSAQANAEAREYADGMMCEVREAVVSLQSAMCDIMCDPAVTNKQAAVEASMKQFQEHLTGLVPEGIEQALQAAQLIAQGVTVNPQGSIVKRRAGMAEDPNANAGKVNKEQKIRRKAAEKARDEAVAARDAAVETAKALEKRVEAAEGRVTAMLKLSPGQRDWLQHPDNQITQDEAGAFLDLPMEKRDAHIEANPVGTLTEKRLAALPADVRKAIERAQTTEEALQKRDAADALVAMEKRAGELGLPNTIAAHFVALNKASPEAFAEVEKLFKALTAQADTAVIFKEFGSNAENADGSATALINKRAEEMMKSDKEIKSIDHAIGKIAESKVPSDVDLWKNYRAELDPRRAAA